MTASNIFSLIREYNNLIKKGIANFDSETVRMNLNDDLKEKGSEFYKDFSSFKKQCEEESSYESYLNLIEEIRYFKAERGYREPEPWKKSEVLTDEIILFEWQGKERIISVFALDYLIAILESLKTYFETVHPTWKALSKNNDSLPVPDEITPPNAPNERKGELILIPPGTYYFQYNIMKELGLIEAISDRYLEINKDTISHKVIGQILYEIFQHKKPSEWSKAHSQYNSGSSNDPIKSVTQKSKLHDFLRRNNLNK